MKKPVQVFNYSINNSAPETVDVHIDGDIVDASTQAMIEAWFGDDTSTSYKSFRNALDKTGANVYNVIINSPGGHVGDAMAIHDYLVELQNKGKTVNTIGRGIVASSATLILLAGKNPEMSENSWFMMHTVSGGIYGTVDQVENYATMMRKFNNSIRDLYASKSGMRKEEVSKLMDAETWLSATEAKEKNLVAVISGNATFTNMIAKENWDFANTAVLNSYNSSVKPPATNQTEDMKKLFTDFKNEIIAAFKGTATENTQQQSLINSLGESIGAQMEALGDKMETEVNNAVSAAVEAAVKPAVENAVKPLNDKISELETEIENNKGAGSHAPAGDKGQTPVGGFE